MNNKKIFVIGDLILDEYIVGDDYRISDEAPVPIVKIHENIYRLGGAANVANNLKHFGCDVILCGAIGEPSFEISAARFLGEMKNQNLSDFYIVKKSPITTTKSRVIIRGQQVVRFDNEKTILPQDVHEEILEKISCLDFRKIGLVVVSDYRKGVITSDIIKALQNSNVKIIVDPKPQHMDLYKGVFCITPNLREFNQITGINFAKESVWGIMKEANLLRKKLNIDLIVITLGERGALYCMEDQNDVVSSHKVEITNMIGAGDTFISAFCSAIVEEKDVGEAVKIANAAAAIVVSKEYTGVCSKKDISDFLEKEKDNG